MWPWPEPGGEEIRVVGAYYRRPPPPSVGTFVSGGSHPLCQACLNFSLLPSRRAVGKRLLSESLPELGRSSGLFGSCVSNSWSRVTIRYCWDKFDCALCNWEMERFHLLPSWVHPKGPRKRQVMNPTSHLPTVPTLLPVFVPTWLLLILQWLTSLDWSTVTELYQFTGTDTCRHTALSLPLAQNSTASLATNYGFHFAAASACTNEITIAMMTVILAQVPLRVFPCLHRPVCPARTGAEKLASYQFCCYYCLCTLTLTNVCKKTLGN